MWLGLKPFPSSSRRPQQQQKLRLHIYTIPTNQAPLPLQSLYLSNFWIPLFLQFPVCIQDSRSVISKLRKRFSFLVRVVQFSLHSCTRSTHLALVLDFCGRTSISILFDYYSFNTFSSTRTLSMVLYIIECAFMFLFIPTNCFLSENIL